MKTIPFKKFILTLLFFGHDASFISNKLKSFGYIYHPSDISEMFVDIKSIMSPKMKEHLEQSQPLDINNEAHRSWLMYFKVFDLYHYISTKNDPSRPPYFKWFDDCLWVHNYQEAMSLVNIFIFNDEPLESIAAILYFRYRKKMSVDALQKYKEYFWNTENLTAPEAFKYCKPFQENAMIIRRMRTGEVAVSVQDIDRDNSVDLPVLLQDSEYIKWKIGYQDVKVPTTRDFLQQVQRDSYFKFYETMQMARSAEAEEEVADSDQFGSTTTTRKRFRNVEENRAKLARQWLDIYLKAQVSMPSDNVGDDNFFERMDQLELKFHDYDKIALISENYDILEDISGDMS